MLCQPCTKNGALPANPEVGREGFAVMLARHLAQLDRFTVPSGCACCGGAPTAHVAAPLPTEDICCATCGRAIYRGFAAKQESQS